jgi:hypothetical protein
MYQIKWAIKTLNRYVKNGEIQRSDINRLECLFALSYLKRYNMNDKLYINEKGKLRVKPENN